MPNTLAKGHLFSTYAKLSEKLPFLTPWCAYQWLVFRKILRTHYTNDSDFKQHLATYFLECTRRYFCLSNNGTVLLHHGHPTPNIFLYLYSYFVRKKFENQLLMDFTEAASNQLNHLKRTPANTK